MAEEFKPVAFSVEPHQFKLIATESDCEISDDIRLTAMASKVNVTELVKFTGECLSLFIHYTVKGRRRIVNKCVTTSFEAFLLFFAAFLYTNRCLLLCLTN